MRSHISLVTGLVALSACGGQVVEPAKADPPAAATPPSGSGATTAPGAADTPADPGDACSVAHPNAASALPAGLSLPANAAGLQLTFELVNQRVELTSIRERGIAPAWTTKDTQIFAPDTTSGDWVETRDAAGALTYQRNVYDPLGRTLEAAPDPNDPNSTWHNSEVCPATATFQVEIPADAAEVRVYGNELAARPTTLFAWYRLR